MRDLSNWIARRSRRAEDEQVTRHASSTPEPVSSTTILVVKRGWIEKEDCTWSTLCGARAKGLIGQPEDGAAFVKEDVLQRTHDELKSLLQGGNVCPTSAFYLETADGRVLNFEHSEVQNAMSAGTYRWA